jgi:hypothetical protein
MRPMSASKEQATQEIPERDPAREAFRRKVEMLIDEIGEQSFPASDPPAWGVAASRLERLERSVEPPQ